MSVEPEEGIFSSRGPHPGLSFWVLGFIAGLESRAARALAGSKRRVVAEAIEGLGAERI